MGEGIVVVFACKDDKVGVAVGITDKLTEKFDAVKFVKVSSEIIDPYLVLIAMAIGAGIGSLFALKVKMTSIPEMVALFNGFGGLSSFFLAWSEFNNHSSISLILIGLLFVMFFQNWKLALISIIKIKKA